MNRILQTVSSVFTKQSISDSESEDVHSESTQEDMRLSARKDKSKHPSVTPLCTTTTVVCVHILSNDMKKCWCYSQSSDGPFVIHSTKANCVTTDEYFATTCFIAFVRGKICKLYSLDGRLVYLKRGEKYLFIASKEEVETEENQSELMIEEQRTGLFTFAVEGDTICKEKSNDISSIETSASTSEMKHLRYVSLEPKGNIVVDRRYLTIGDHGRPCFHNGPFAVVRDAISFEYSKSNATCRLKSTWNGRYLRYEKTSSDKSGLVADCESAAAAVFQVHWHDKAFFALSLPSGFLSSRPNGSISCTSAQDKAWEHFHLSPILTCVPKETKISVEIERLAGSRRKVYSSVVIPCDCRTAFSVISDYDHLKCFCRQVIHSENLKQLSSNEYEIHTTEQHNFLCFSKKSEQVLKVKEFFPTRLILLVFLPSNCYLEAQVYCILSLQVWSRLKSSVPGFLLDAVCRVSCQSTMEDIRVECIRRMKCYHDD
eukprot:jgi/Galph1/3254/GphlegSOOS_G1929.1